MNALVSYQLIVFGWAILYGVTIGLSYDFIRILRRIVRHSKIFVALEDFFFWIIVGLFVFNYILRANSGSMRGFIFIGMSLGSLLYFLTISKWLIATFVKGLQLLINFFKMIFKTIFLPLKILLRPLKVFSQKTSKSLKKSKKWLIIGLRRFIKEVYYILKKV